MLIPTTRPRLSTNGPPLLPGFKATSLWMMASIRRPSCARRVRPRALTTPALTVKEKPSGLPMATTSWPTRNVALRPSSAAGRWVASMCTTARSVAGSSPTTCAECVVPSGSEMATSRAPRTTCALVRRYPSGVKSTPEPPPSGRKRLRDFTETLATAGPTLSTTEVTARE